MNDEILDEKLNLLYAHTSLLRAAVFALFEAAPDKAALRESFLRQSQLNADLQLKFPVSDSALESAEVTRTHLLNVLKPDDGSQADAHSVAKQARFVAIVALLLAASATVFAGAQLL